MQNHYNYVFDNLTSTYNFVTKNKILYRVAFVVDQTFSTISGEEIPNVFQIILEKGNDEFEVYDSKVSKTVASIIENFFQNVENALIYVCSEEKDKAEKRNMIFDRWYKNYKHKDFISKIDKIISIRTSNIEVQQLYTSLIFHKENPNQIRLIEIYDQIENTLNTDSKENRCRFEMKN
ncbi:DUF6169 family protein [Arthrospiribacter ruber]|uniref:Uncharacterized protein n=1 Tax=Arthrospiribacter ruber TaxID=2487934 RepID=A0A951MBY7_9BACT|nr:DUF6169 family protein [Arthrospiribacter ruber]MBW3466585.1 hypothetical protein [Arthrospiribacter ruber]